MSDIFNRAADAFGGSFAADAAQITFVQPGILGSGVGQGGGGVGMLVQQLQFTYQQQITRVYELGSNLAFYIAGRTQGQASLGRILGPRPIALTFYQQYGDVCNAAQNNLDVQLAAGCAVPGQFQAGNGSFAFTLKFCVITSIGVSMQAQDMMINEQLQLMFASFTLRSLTNNGNGGGGGITAIEAIQQGEALAAQIISILGGLSGLSQTDAAAVVHGYDVTQQIIALAVQAQNEEEAAAAAAAGESLALQLVNILAGVDAASAGEALAEQLAELFAEVD